MFIGREPELRELREFLDGNDPGMAVLYGRRRVGKTALIRQALEGQRFLIFEGVENRPKREQIAAFLFQLGLQVGDSSVAQRECKRWMEAFGVLREKLDEHGQTVVVLDEFQWSANYRREIVGDLKMMWELYLSKVPGCKLILCGSIASFMISKVIKSTALYGRVDCVIHLKAFKLEETARMLPNCGFEDVLLAQILYGGIPHYLGLARKEPSIMLSPKNLAFREGGYLYGEFDRIFVSHFGRTPAYERLIATLAAHPYGLSRQDVARKAEVEAGKSTTQYLFDLESAGFLRADIPIDKDIGSRLLRYTLTDAYLRFYFAFIRPHRKEIESGRGEALYADLRNSGRFYGWLGRAFELVCIQHAERISQILGFSGVRYRAGPYFRPATRNREPGVQIDLVFDRADRVLTLCEMKNQRAPVGKEVIPATERKARRLEARFSGRTVHRVLVTANETTRDLELSGYFYRIIRAEELTLRK